MDSHKAQLSILENSKIEMEEKIASLQIQIDKMEEKKKFLETSLEPYQERIVFDGNQKASIDALKTQTDGLLDWFEEFKSNLPKLKEASEKLPKTISQNFNDLREIFNKIKDFESKYKSFAQLKSELDAKAVKGDPKILDIFFKNRDLAMKEQDRIYNILNLFKQNDFEIKSLVDLYAMMMPDEVLNATADAVNNNLDSLTTVLQKLDFESMINEINNNVKSLG
jgi:chromosome segregation ATPase